MSVTVWSPPQRGVTNWTNPAPSTVAVWVAPQRSIIDWSNLTPRNVIFWGAPQGPAGATGAAFTTAPVTLSANTNDWALGVSSTPTIFSVTNLASGTIDVTGIAGGTAGMICKLINLSAENFWLRNNDSLSASGNRFLFPAGDVLLAENNTIALFYDGTYWREG